MFPEEFPDYNGSIYNDEAYIIVVYPEIDASGCKSWNTNRISLADLAAPERSNLTTTEKLGTDYGVPTDGVLAAYVDKNGIPRLADKDGHPAQFLLVGTDYVDKQSYAVATPGVVELPSPGHNYIIGRTYYLGKGGVPVTKEEGQRLFSVLDAQRIIVY